MPEAEHVMEYHVLTSGECWAGLVGAAPIKMRRGDVVLLPHGDAHVVSSAPGMRADPAVDSYFEQAPTQRPFRFHYEGTAPARLLMADTEPPPPGAAARQRSAARAFERDDVRRRDPPPRRAVAARNVGLARRLARPLCRPRARFAARAAGGAVDDRGLEQPSRAIALGAARALRHAN